MIGTKVRALARRAGSPIRTYFNGHFEMVKAEIRHAARPVEADVTVRLAEMESSNAEMFVYESRLLNRISDDVVELAERVSELERVVAQLAAVVAATTPDGEDLPRSPSLR